jgi:hypothetical protein
MYRDITGDCGSFGVLNPADEFTMLLAIVGYRSEFPESTEDLVVSTTPSPTTYHSSCS